MIMMFCHAIFLETMSNTEGPAENQEIAKENKTKAKLWRMKDKG